LMGSLNMPQTNPRWHMAAILKETGGQLVVSVTEALVTWLCSTGSEGFLVTVYHKHPVTEREFEILHASKPYTNIERS